MEGQILRRVPWTCLWGSFDSQALSRDASGDRCFWHCCCPKKFDAPHPVVKGESDECAFWQPRRSADNSSDE